ncbi:protein DD3-3 [Octopus sinensis]|uniref:Protein DD3-3 n=1 Tax=Octopus sinensis TaxID=2607531 RepID=A0A6P7S7W6_9MOLL|nr:protein DD3-3 [Octopus sinensis]
MSLKCAISCLLLFAIITAVNSDIFCQSPRGSNNRLNEKSAQRKEANRLFDSQNNNKGGYNVGDATDAAAKKVEDQYQMKYFQSASISRKDPKKGNTFLKLEWVNQHGCGVDDEKDPNKKRCNIILQYMCQKMNPDDKLDVLRDGVNTNKQNFNEKNVNPKTRKESHKIKGKAVKADSGLHETWDWYHKCYQRERNNGLFAADQNLNDKNGYKRATQTRQNNGGGRSGYECPEERDYYPYWHPTPWLDIAVFSQKSEDCQNYRDKSFNQHNYGECVEFYPDKTRKCASRYNNKAACESNKKTWVEFSSYLEKAPEYKTAEECKKAKSKVNVEHVWGLPWDTKNISHKECLVRADVPVCQKAAYSRTNHLGNGLSGTMNSFMWKLPYFPSGNEKRCVFRIRYNISTDDYDPATTTAAQNGKKSPVQNDPVVNVAGLPLQLAINTAQFGRVFQDRSHVFHLMPRPKDVTQNIHNLNVRGKRGNIVQTFPAVEYDFVPNSLTINSDDLVHIQWTGSNTHNNNNDGNDGEGNAGTDRHNIVQSKQAGVSYPLPYGNTTLWKNSRIVWIYHKETKIGPQDLALSLASSGYYTCVNSAKCPAALAKDSLNKKAKMNNVLNNAPASYKGVLLSIKKGNYYYLCSRNNNFTNRSQKGVIHVK